MIPAILRSALIPFSGTAGPDKLKRRYAAQVKNPRREVQVFRGYSLNDTGIKSH
jgi:hypothetical protein